MKPLTGPLASLCLCLLFSPTLTWSAQDAHGHEFLHKSDALTVAQAYAAALKNAPEASSTRVRQQQADNYLRLGKQWLPGRNRVSVNYLDDSNLDDIGSKEFSAELEFDLWQIGAKRVSQKLGQSYQRQTQAWERYLQLLVAGRMRSILAKIQQREILLAHAHQAQRDAQQLKSITDGLFRAGATPRDSVLQAQSLLLEQNKLLLRAEAMLVDEERQYRNLTGLNQRPAQALTESRSQRDAIDSTHPQLRLLQASLDIATLNISKTKHNAKSSPTVSVGMRRERGERLENYTDSLGLGFSIPFGGSTAISAQVSDAVLSKVDAEIAYQSTARQLNQQLHEVEHELTLTQAAIPLSEMQAQLRQQRWQMANKAFKAGETTLLQVIQALQKYRTASTEYQLLKFAQQRLIGEFNQTVGSLPGEK